MSSNSIYGLRRNGNAHGDVFTSPEVVCYMLDLIGYTEDKNLSQYTILEPSCGEGEFVLEIARRLLASASRYGFDASDSFQTCVKGYDIDEKKIAICKQRLSDIGIACTGECIVAEDYLTSNHSQYDAVVGNPPYVRYENIPAEKRALYKTLFPTFYYRSDLYVLFYEKSLRQLKRGGKHCFICANRWLKNEYGKKLRRLIACNYSIERIIDMEHSDAFTEDVLAYPAITLISNTPSQPTFDYGSVNKVKDINDISFERRKYPIDEDWSHSFNIACGNRNLFTIEELGFKIGIGVATGADSVFVSKELPEKVEKELLLPALNARDLRGNTFKWSANYLLNPYQPNGELIDLKQYPRAEEYLTGNKDRLLQRHTVKNSGKWYKTIDRINPELVHLPKILLPDLSGNRYIFVDEGNYYPLHNLYYITGKTKRELALLSAILMSDTVLQQIKSITNNMNGGFPRWQSQHLRKLRIPNLDTISTHYTELLLKYYYSKDIQAVNQLVGKIYDTPTKQTIYKPMIEKQQLAFSFAV